MKYNEFKENRKQIKLSKTKKTFNNDSKKKLISILKFMGKIVVSLLRLLFNLLNNFINILLWIFNECVDFISAYLQLIFLKMDDNKREKTIQRIVSFMLILILGGVSLLGFKMIHKSDNNQSTTVSSMANKNITPDVDFFGTIAMKSTIGGVNPDYYGETIVRYQQSGKTVVKLVKSYGLGEFSTVEGIRYAKDFTDYLKEIDDSMYTKYFDNVGKPGTTTFTSAWQSAGRSEKKFKDYQFNYIFITYVQPTIDAIKDEYKLDMMSSKALKEFIYSTATQYGLKGTLTLFEKAGVNSNMKDEEIIKLVQQEKINSLGVYTYTEEWKYDDKDRENVKTRSEEELEQFLKLL